MPITLLVHAGAASTDTITATTPARNTTGASLIVLGASYYIGGVAPTISDSKSNIWTTLNLNNGGASSGASRLRYCVNPTTDVAHTFLISGANDFPVLTMMAFSGTEASSPFDVQVAIANATGITSIATGSISPNVDGEVIITQMTTTGASSGYSIDSGFSKTDGAEYLVSFHMGGAMAYKIQTAKAAVNPTWSWTSSTGASAVIASFKPQVSSFIPRLSLLGAG